MAQSVQHKLVNLVILTGPYCSPYRYVCAAVCENGCLVDAQCGAVTHSFYYLCLVVW